MLLTETFQNDKKKEQFLIQNRNSLYNKTTTVITLKVLTRSIKCKLKVTTPWQPIASASLSSIT